METFSPPPAELVNENNPYINSLREAGFSLREVKNAKGTMNAVVYNHAQNSELRTQNSELRTSSKKNNMLLLYAVSGEAGGTSHISASFLSELKADVDTVMGFSSAVSASTLEAGKYNHDLDHQVDQIVDMYKNSIPEDEKDKPIVLVGHSMGGTTSPMVAKRLLEEGFNVSDIIMIAPPGLVERSSAKMVTDFIKLGRRQHVDPDIPALYPSPIDIANFSGRLGELTDKKGSKRLTREETEELAYYELALQRSTDPDKLLLSNMTPDERKRVQNIDDELRYQLEVGEPESQDQIEKLQKERSDVLFKRTKEVISGVIENQSTQQAARGGRAIRNLMRSGRQITKSVSMMAGEVTVGAVQDVIDFNNTLPDHSLHITLLSGDNDPIIGDYEVGQVDRIKVGPNTTYSEIDMHEFDHFSLPSDPIRVAHVVQRIIEK